MDPGEIPAELQDLTYIEQMLISRVHPVVSLYRVNGGQYAYSRSVINFTQNIHEYIDTLPMNVEELTSTILFNRDTAHGVAQFRVRSDKVLRALLWLKRHNIYYKDISISYDNLDKLPSDGQIVSMLKNMNIVESIETLDSDASSELDDHYIINLQSTDQEQYINKELELPYPTCETKPLNEFESEGYIACAFPVLFPYGTCDFLQSRIHSITCLNYFKFLMCYKDGRFAKDPRFRYFELNTILPHNAITQSNLYVKKFKLSDLTVLELRDLIKNDSSKLTNIMVHCARIKSTKSYWSRRYRELTNMVDQIGKPTIFFTLSAADYHWPDLFRLLAPSTDYSDLQSEQKRNLMHDNPLIVGYFFKERVELFMSKVLIPVFRVKDYWYRFEWQNRGSPHVHGLLYLQDEPEFIVNDLSEDHIHKIQEYFDMLCLAINPKSANPTCSNHPSQQRFSDISAAEYENDLGELINAFQRHTKCGTHCYRRGNANTHCRFKFPKDVQESSSIDDKHGYYEFFPRRNDPYVQRFNNVVTQIWRANTDFTPILDINAVVKYIVKYTTKSETASFSYMNVINSLCKHSDDVTSAKSCVMKLLISSVTERDYSAQEVTHLLMGWSLMKSTRNFVSLILYKENWKKYELNEEDVNRNSNSIIDKYIDRPLIYNDLSLFRFAQTINVYGNRYVKSRKENVVLVLPKLKLSDDLDSDLYYKQQCTLHIPFRQSVDELSKLCDNNNEHPCENATRSVKNSSNLQKITLSPEQLKVIQICRTQIQHIQSNIGDISDQIIKRVIIQGKAGSGKSTLINAIVQEVTDALGCDAIAIIAPTGAAALNRNFQLEHKALKFLIIDEMFMIGAKTLGEIESRCHELFPSRDDSFAGLYVFMFGDYKQLSPVKDVALYNNSVSDAMATKGAIVFQSFQLFIELSISHRQGNDRIFSKLLDNLANGDISVDEYNMLSQRKMSLLDETEMRRFYGAIHLIPTNDLVRQKNECCLRELGTPVLCINAQINGDVHKVNDDYCGLAPSLYLAIGCRVMLTQNIWVNGGLVNGSIGTVRAILYEENVSPPNLPSYVIIQFPLYHGPFIHDNLFPIKPVTRSYEKRGIICTIKQFPLKLAYACTIHKAQGMTLPTAIIDIGEKEFSAGITYVALSRLRPGDRAAFLLTAQALLQHKAVDDAQRDWFGRCARIMLGTPYEVCLNLLCHGHEDDEDQIYQGDRDAFWLATLTLARHERMDDAHKNWFAVCVEAMLKSYSVTYSGPQCHEENWEPEEDGVCPMCLKKLSEKPPSPGPWYIL
ncbi:hypothetical protein TKK_0003004 [Trichogramma kaykai]